jgi:cytochrome b involved in lipid metabolism
MSSLRSPGESVRNFRVQIVGACDTVAATPHMGCNSSSENDAGEAPLADLGHKRGGQKKRRTGASGKRGGELKRNHDTSGSWRSAAKADGDQGGTGDVNISPFSAASSVRWSDLKEELAREEEKARAEAALAERRQRDMLTYDFREARPCTTSTGVVKSTRSGGLDVEFDFDTTANDDEDYFEDAPRRSTMNSHELEAAKRVSLAHNARVSTSARFSTTPAAAAPPRSVEGVRSHASEDDCWVIVHGHVYDVTTLLEEHPGGSYAIFQHGGTDCSVTFDQAHPVKPMEALRKYSKGKVTTSI